jgi:hypothetical protein
MNSKNQLQRINKDWKWKDINSHFLKEWKNIKKKTWKRQEKSGDVQSLSTDVFVFLISHSIKDGKGDNKF